MDLEKLNLVELNAQEVKEIQGGDWWKKLLKFKLTITGVLDGIPNNTTSDCVIFGIKLW